MKKQILLFLVRWYETIGKPLPSWLERTCDKDISLGLELDEEREFTRELEQKPNWNPVKPNPFLTERIIASLDDSESTVVSKIAWKEISIGIAACVAIALAYQWVGIQSEPGNDYIANNDVVESPIDSDTMEVLPEVITRLADKSDWKNPLDQEIEYVLGDAKGALDFLADSFVPSSFLNSEHEG